jgi:clan AA aspartic protease (TIGR02281 family)
MLKTTLLAAIAALGSVAATSPASADQIWSNAGDAIQVSQAQMPSGVRKCSFMISNRSAVVEMSQWPNGGINLAVSREVPKWANGGSVTFTVDGGTPFTTSGGVKESIDSDWEWLATAIPNEGAGRDFLHDMWNGQTLHIAARNLEDDFSLAGSATAILHLHQCGDAIATPEVVTAAATQPFGAARTPATTRVKLGVWHSTHTIEAVVNGHQTFFTLDTGASLVVLPRSILGKMRAEGSIGSSDFVRYATIVDASGNTARDPVYLLHSVTVGGITVHDVECGFGEDEDTLLLGLSFLSRLPSYSIDNRTNEFVIGNQ